MSKPILTIGMIFRNDIRSIERCLKALAPLREAVPCELVMADTGSTDGSRQVAERYADILFDFPWIDDFSAARNAVMDRASGKWYFSVDTDEYLDGDVTELKQFLRQTDQWTAAFVVVRNYANYELEGAYSDFMAQRLLRMSTGVRYQGVIHEAWIARQKGKQLRCVGLARTILHHDGYVGLGDERGKAKRQRNLAYLRKKLELEPDNMMVWLQLVDSSVGEPDMWDTIEKAADLVEAKKNDWERAGPPILRKAAVCATEERRADAEQWIERAERLFPDSYFTRLDVQYAKFLLCLWQKDFAACIQPGEAYLQAMEDYRAGKAIEALATNTFQSATIMAEQDLRISLAVAYEKEGQPERALPLLESIDYSKDFDTQQAAQVADTLLNIHTKSELDTAPVLTKIWDAISAADLDGGKPSPLKKSLLDIAASVFVRKSSDADAEKLCRRAHTLLLPLEDKCEQGRAAAILEADDPAVLEEKLSRVENWTELPIQALAHALECGASFPVPDKPLNIEEMDSLVARLYKDKERVIALACETQKADSSRKQTLTWMRGLTIAAVQVFNWNAEDVDADTGLSVARAFAQAERAYLSFCYAPQALCEENLFVLPPMHRFGWYCAQAFEQLDKGNASGYVHLLKEGLISCEGMKSMVEFLLKHTPQLKDPADELANLAEQIRTVLAKFAPDDPAVAALKQSEAYQKVAYLIEGMSVPVVGGLTQ